MRQRNDREIWLRCCDRARHLDRMLDMWERVNPAEYDEDEAEVAARQRDKVQRLAELSGILYDVASVAFDRMMVERVGGVMGHPGGIGHPGMVELDAGDREERGMMMDNKMLRRKLVGLMTRRGHTLQVRLSDELWRRLEQARADRTVSQYVRDLLWWAVQNRTPTTAPKDNLDGPEVFVCQTGETGEGEK